MSTEDRCEITPVRLRGEMARRGLLRVQLGAYEDPDTQRWVLPRQDKDTVAAAWEFLTWLDRETE